MKTILLLTFISITQANDVLSVSFQALKETPTGKKTVENINTNLSKMNIKELGMLSPIVGYVAGNKINFNYNLVKEENFSINSKFNYQNNDLKSTIVVAFDF